MTTTKPSTGGAGGEFVKGIAGLLLIAAVVYFVQWGLGVLYFLWRKVKLGFMTAGKLAVCVGGLVILAFLIALLCDALAPWLRKWKKGSARLLAISRCRLPDVNTFRTGVSSREGEVGKVDAWMASLLRNRYRELTGSFPDRFTFRNNQAAYSTFKAGELPPALLSARSQIEQDLFAPLIAAYRTGDNHQIRKEERP